jgi:hypothetical protein
VSNELTTDAHRKEQLGKLALRQFAAEHPVTEQNLTDVILLFAQTFGYLALDRPGFARLREWRLGEWRSAYRAYCAEHRLPVVVAFVGTHASQIVVERRLTQEQIVAMDSLMAPHKNSRHWADYNYFRRYRNLRLEDTHRLACAAFRIARGEVR